MTIISGTGDIRSDCKHFAKCKKYSRYYCRLYCQKRKPSRCNLIIPIRHRKSKAHRKKYKTNWAKENRQKANEYRRKLLKKRQKWLNNYKLKKGCAICGYKRCPQSLDAHHINQEEKDFDIAKGMRKRWSQERIEKELQKCVILCRNCHYEVHFGYIVSPNFKRRAI